MHNVFIFFSLSVSYNVFAVDEFSNSVDLTFTVNIQPPVCRLEKTLQSIEFGDLSVQDINRSENKKKSNIFIYRLYQCG